MKKSELRQVIKEQTEKTAKQCPAATQDVSLTKIDRSTYAAIPNKLSTGTPSQYYVDRQTTPTISLYQTPDAGTYQDYHNTVNSSADGSVSRTALTFPRNNMKACFPFRTSGYNSPGWYGIDTQGRVWVWGHYAAIYEYRANTGAESFSKAFLMPAPMQHTLTGQSQWWIGDSDLRFEDILSFGHYYNGYYTHIADTTKKELWMIGNNYYYQHGENANVHFQFWHKRNP